MWQSTLVGPRDHTTLASSVANRVLRYPGLTALALLCIVIGAALLLAHRYHLGVATMSAGILLGLPGLFLAWRAVAPRSGLTATVDLAPLADQLQRAIDEPRPAVTGRPVSLAPRPALLAGREALLADLHDLLAGGDGPWPQVAVHCGKGGMGKTSVAVEYAHRHLAEVGVAWQLAARDPVVVATGLAELAGQLGAHDKRGARDPVKSAHAALAAHPSEWLLVFDDALGPESVRAFLPSVGHGRVLITSQNSSWPAGQAVDVPLLDSDAAAEFLVNRTGDRDLVAATARAKRLGELPLLLEQAAAYIEATGTTLAGYLSLFREHWQDLLARGKPAGYDKTVATKDSAWARMNGESVNTAR
jgi:hypothetical protein